MGSLQHGSKPRCWIHAGIMLLSALLLHAGIESRREWRLPDIPGYQVLICDFHMHTVFSDGMVWPGVRVREAWREGLDAIAITDHVEKYHPHENDIPINHERSYEIAAAEAVRYDLIVIKGAEITKDLPPGHFNALFISRAAPLAQKDFMDALAEAVNQGAFIFWNHPSYKHPENRSEWFPVHQQLLEKGWLHGIEVANGNYHYPEAHDWCLSKDLTMMGVSDSHDPIGMEYDFCSGHHRPLTFVLAGERSESGIREALFNQRTIVYWKNRLIGKERFLRALFYAAIEVSGAHGDDTNHRVTWQHMTNHSDLPFYLRIVRKAGSLYGPARLYLPPRRTIMARLYRDDSREKETGSGGGLSYRVTNLFSAPGRSVIVELPVEAKQ